MQIQTCPKFGVREYVLGLSHREVAELSGIGRNEKDTNSPFTDPKANSRSTFIWKSTTSLAGLVFKPILLLHTGCRTFSNYFIEETGWLRPVLPVVRLVPGSDSCIMQGEDLLALVVLLWGSERCQQHACCSM